MLNLKVGYLSWISRHRATRYKNLEIKTDAFLFFNFHQVQKSFKLCAEQLASQLTFDGDDVSSISQVTPSSD